MKSTISSSKEFLLVYSIYPNGSAVNKKILLCSKENTKLSVLEDIRKWTHLLKIPLYLVKSRRGTIVGVIWSKRGTEE
jgi:hypothetical protein